jgi:hypothetical protein
MGTGPTGNVVYPKWKQALVQEAQANKSLDQTDVNNAVYCALLNVGTPTQALGYTYSAAHQFYTDLLMAPTVGSGHELAVFNGPFPQSNPGPLDKQITTPTVNIGAGTFPGPVFDGDDSTFLQVTTTAGGFVTVDALVLYRRNAGLNSTWRLIYYCDTGAGFPVQPNGGNITINWNAAGIFML